MHELDLALVWVFVYVAHTIMSRQLAIHWWPWINAPLVLTEAGKRDGLGKRMGKFFLEMGFAAFTTRMPDLSQELNLGTERIAKHAKAKSESCSREAWGRYFTSFLQSVITCSLILVVKFYYNDDLAWQRLVVHEILAYFVADVLVDRDPGYVNHHLCSVIYYAILRACGGHLRWGLWLIFCFEGGNAPAHGAALRWGKQGIQYKTVRNYSMAISRTLSLPFALLVILFDFPNSISIWIKAFMCGMMLLMYRDNLRSMRHMFRK